MFLTKIPKNLIIIAISLCFLFTFSFIAACRSAETAETAETTTEETTEEIVDTAEEEVDEPEQETEEIEEVAEEEVEEPEEETDEVEETTEEKEETGGIMIIESNSFKNNEMIPAKYTCDAENIIPPLTFSGVPEEAKSLVLIVDDPDAPGGTWVHWTVWNIDPETTEIPENSVPGGAVEGTNSWGVPEYGGPCPPSGTHRYFFKLYALDITLDLGTSSTAGDIMNAIEGHILANAELIGLYERS